MLLKRKKAVDITLIEKYFTLDTEQKDKFGALFPVFARWNERINLISRKDLPYFYLRHVLHSLAPAKIVDFLPGARVLDLGTGGGFPGLPLAIMFPQTRFHLIDSIGKKIKAVQAMADELNLENVSTEQVRAENHHEKYDFVLTRAVASLPKLAHWSAKNIRPGNRHRLPNGLIALKGGDLTAETAGFDQIQIIPISRFFDETFFETKKMVYLPYTEFS